MKALTVANGLCKRHEHVERCRRGGGIARTSDGREFQGVEAAPERRWHHLANRAERADGGLFDASAHGRGRTQRDGDRDGLFVVEEERRQRVAGVEAVSALGAHGGLDAVAHLAETFDVSANRALADVEAGCQQRSRPLAAGLQQRQQAEQSFSRRHVFLL